MKLAVICAMEQEIRLLTNYEDHKSIAGVPFCTNVFGGNETVIALSGIGKANAASATQLIIDTFHPDAILNIGLAGNASPLPLGGVVIPNRAVYHDFDMEIASHCSPYVTSYSPTRSLMELADEILTEMGIPHMEGLLATGDVFVDKADLKADIISRTHCKAIEMEGAAIAQIAQKNVVPYVLVKVLSDNADDNAGDDFDSALSIDSYIDTSVNFIERFAARLEG